LLRAAGRQRETHRVPRPDRRNIDAPYGFGLNGPGLPTWPAYEAASDEHLEFSDEVRVDHGLYKEACDLFEKIVTERARSGSIDLMAGLSYI
jgi:hypothetical protein